MALKKIIHEKKYGKFAVIFSPRCLQKPKIICNFAVKIYASVQSLMHAHSDRLPRVTLMLIENKSRQII